MNPISAAPFLALVPVVLWFSTACGARIPEPSPCDAAPRGDSGCYVITIPANENE